jgi:hypothetical protein
MGFRVQHCRWENPKIGATADFCAAGRPEGLPAFRARIMRQFSWVNRCGGAADGVNFSIRLGASARDAVVRGAQ